MTDMTDTAVHEKLLRLLGGDERRDLRRRLRRRFELAPADAAPATFRLGKLSATDYALIASLMGHRQRLGASAINVDVDAISSALAAAGVATSLREALERLDGPIIDRRAARDATARRWDATAQRSGDGRLTNWLATPSGMSRLKRIARQDVDAAADLAAQAERVLEVLPAPGIPRAELAARTLGDAHALDAGTPVAAIVLAVLRHATPLVDPAGEPSGEEPPDVPQDGSVDQHGASNRERERDRHVWAEVGVLVNELARPVLVLDLPLVDGAVVGGRWREPALVTLRTLVRSPPPLAVAGSTVFVCENPNLVALISDRLGQRSAPLVCTEGMPAAAQRTLLQALARAGARLRYHGDFDWAGLRIAATVMALCGAEPWRFDAAAYRAAVAHARGVPLTGVPADSPWDPELAKSMNAIGTAIAEEALADGLIDDLKFVAAETRVSPL